MKLATWNVNSLAVRLPQVLDWLAASIRSTCWCCRKPSSPTTSSRTPRSRPPATRRSGSARRPTTASRCCRSDAPTDVGAGTFPASTTTQARVIAGTVDGVRVIGAYFPNGQAPGSDKFALQDAAGSTRCATGCARNWPRHPRLVLMGDFNIAPEDRDVYDPVAWAGQIHCTDEERAQFRALLGARPASTRSACSSSRRRAGAGGTTATSRSAGTRACASTTSWSARRCKPRGQACAIDKLPRKNERPERPRAGGA